MASGPWDNVQLQGPPNGPAWAQAAAQMMGAVNGAVNNSATAFRNMSDWGYQQQQRNFFQDPNNLAALQQAMPQNQYSGLIQSLLQSGGTPAIGQASQLIPTLQRQQLIDQYINDNGGGGGQPQPAKPTAVFGVTGKNSPTSTPDSNSYNAGLAPNIRQMAIDSGVDPTSPQFKKAFGGVDIDRDLTNQSVINGAQQRIDKLKNGSETPNRGGISPVAQSGPGDQGSEPSRAAASNQLNPSTGEGSSAQSPQQTGERRTAQAAAQPEGNPSLGAGAMVSQQFRQNPQAFADYLHQQAEDIRRRNRLGELIGISSKTAEDRAKAYDDRAKAVEEQLGKDVGLTTEQKNERGGTTARVEAEKGKIVAGQKELDSINKTGSDARLANEKLKLPMRLVNDPGFYSGPMENVNRAYKQWTASLGGNPNAGVPQEAFKKSVNDLLSEQIRTMAASGVGRILLAEVQTMKDSIASLGTTRATDRLLLEEVNRLHNYQSGVQDLASAYLKTHTYLDQGFYSELSKFHDQHPMYTEAELRDPRLIAPPRMPAAIAREQQRGQPLTVRGQQWAKTMGLQPGDTIAGEDGNGRFKLPAFQ